MTSLPNSRASRSAKKTSKKRSKKQRGKGAETPEEPKLSRKEEQRLKREAAKARAQLIQFTVGAIAFSGFIGLLVGLLVEPTLGIAVTAGLMCLTLSFKYQRQAFYAFIIYIPFSGTVVYALGGNSLLQLAKDAFYIPALIGVIQFCRAKRLPILIPKAVTVPLSIVAVILLMTLLLVNLPQHLQAGGGEKPLFMGLLGVKVILGYLPVITCIYYLMRTKEDLYFLLRVQAVLVLVACTLGMVQYLMLTTGICPSTEATGATGDDLFKASLQARCFVGGALLYSPSQGQIRLPGTFVAPWQWGWFLIASAFFSFGTTFNDRSPFWRLIGMISLATVFIMSVLSGQRIALFLVPVAVITLSILTGQVTNLKRFLPIGVILGLVLIFVSVRNPEVMQARIDSFVGRWNASPPHEFILQQFTEVREGREGDGLLGEGVARATNAARIFGKVRLVETYHPKLLYELGPLGLLSILALYTTIMVKTFQAYRATKDKNLRGYAASMWVFVLFISYFPYYYPLDVDPVGVYYWLAAGICLKIPMLDKRDRELAKEAAALKAGKKVKKRRKQAEFV
ncbi:MAG: hormogonium polysaccharide biosynthesis protein HpsL [Cyanobacteria bacterium J06632_22]